MRLAAAYEPRLVALLGFRDNDELLEFVRMREHAFEDRNAPAWVVLTPPGTPEHCTCSPDPVVT